MNMQESDFRRALEIITRNNRITVSFNTPIADNYSHVYPLFIHERMPQFSKNCTRRVIRSR